MVVAAVTIVVVVLWWRCTKEGEGGGGVAHRGSGSLMSSCGSATHRRAVCRTGLDATRPGAPLPLR